MEGIKEAIAFITGLAVKAEDPKTVNINGKTYCTKDLVRYDAPEKAAPYLRNHSHLTGGLHQRKPRRIARSYDYSGSERNKGAFILPPAC